MTSLGSALNASKLLQLIMFFWNANYMLPVNWWTISWSFAS